MNRRINEIVDSVNWFVEDYGEGIVLVLGAIGGVLALIYWILQSS